MDVIRRLAELKAILDAARAEKERAFAAQGSRSLSSLVMPGDPVALACRACERAENRYHLFCVRHEETFPPRPKLSEFCDAERYRPNSRSRYVASAASLHRSAVERWRGFCRPRTAQVRAQLRKLFPCLQGCKSYVLRYSERSGTQILRFGVPSNVDYEGPVGPLLAERLLRYEGDCGTVAMMALATVDVADGPVKKHVLRSYVAGDMPNQGGKYLSVKIRVSDPCPICFHEGERTLYHCEEHSREERACYDDLLKEKGVMLM